MFAPIDIQFQLVLCFPLFPSLMLDKSSGHSLHTSWRGACAIIYLAQARFRLINHVGPVSECQFYMLVLSVLPFIFGPVVVSVSHYPILC